MQYKVTGTNKDTGARMILELEANNRADAERKATQSGMLVNHVQEIRDDGDQDHPRTKHRGEFDERSGAAGKMIVLLIIVAIIGAAWYYWRTT